MKDTVIDIQNRRSVKEYKPEQITDEELMAVLNAGMNAPSGGNKQSPVFIAVQNPEWIKKLCKLNAEIAGAPEGFDVFYGGFRGVTIRAAVLLPYLLSCLMDRKYTGVILCILAEACMVWTLYGTGVCLLVAVAWLVLGILVSLFRKRWEKRKTTDAHGRSGEEATE